MSAKVYMAEITPAQSRGRYMGILNSFFYGKEEDKYEAKP